MENRTKIIATIGPASSSDEVLSELIMNGVRLARLNFSFGTHDEHKERIAQIRKISEELEIPVAIIQDLQGPKLRVQKILDGAIDLEANNSITLIESLDVDKNTLSITYPNLYKFVSKGMHLLLDDGLIELKIDEIEQAKIHCVVLHGGHLVEGKGLNIPSRGLKIPAITEKDREDLKFGLENNVDFAAMSFVRTEKEIIELKSIIAHSERETQIIAKIEKPEAIENMAKILNVADSLMVARGDLAIEMPLEQVPSLQRWLIELCHTHTKPVITATQLLWSMEVNPRPTRAEVSDVANAINEGTDAVMLSGETAIGKFPVESVKTLVKIINEAEKTAPKLHLYEKSKVEPTQQIPSGVSQAVRSLAEELQAKAIFTFTTSGFTALAISKQRPLIPIVALTPFPDVQRRCNLYWGVKAVVIEEIDSTDKIFDLTERIALKEKVAQPGDIVIITAGIPFGVKGTTNLIKVHTI